MHERDLRVQTGAAVVAAFVIMLIWSIETSGNPFEGQADPQTLPVLVAVEGRTLVFLGPWTAVLAPDAELVVELDGESSGMPFRAALPAHVRLTHETSARTGETRVQRVVAVRAYHGPIDQ